MADDGNTGPDLPFGRVPDPQVPPVPDATYDDGRTHVISIKPHELTVKAQSLSNTISDMTDTLKKITTTWDELKLGWVGQSQQEADDFNRKWQAAAKAMFGDDKTPEKLSEIGPNECALGKIQSLAKAAAITYANTEESLATSLYKFGMQLGGTYNPGEWSDSDPAKHPELRADIPVADRGSGGSGSTDRNNTDGPIWEQTKPS